MELLGKDRAKRLGKLLKAKGRQGEGKVLLDSTPLIDEAFKAGLVSELFVLEGVESHFQAVAAEEGVRVTSCTEVTFPRLLDVKSSIGVVALAHIASFVDLEAPSFDAAALNFVLFLDHISDPGNLGTIARSAAAFGCDLFLLSPNCADPYSPKCLRASAGALLRLKIAQAPLAAQHPWPHFFRATSDGGTSLDDVTLPERRGLWLGNEAHGPGEVPPGLATTDVTIPMHRDSESLNVTAAAAILSFAFAKK